MLVVKLYQSEVILSLHKINQPVLPSGDTTPLQNLPNSEKPKHYPKKRRFQKLIKSLNILNQIFNKLKHTNRRITQIITIYTKNNESSSSDKEIILIKKHKLKHTNRRIT